jgi:hypothetical protein
MNLLIHSSSLTKKQVCIFLNISPNTLRTYLKNWGIYEDCRGKKLLNSQKLHQIHQFWFGEK